MIWVLQRNVSLRRFFQEPTKWVFKSHVGILEHAKLPISIALWNNKTNVIISLADLLRPLGVTLVAAVAIAPAAVFHTV